ncbi:MAG TPA: hypothetical protein VE198_10895 [Actinoallomurus sp.]|jgi:broad specificity phosphatase PhoE|nr:hypothetical protein [Actinoallomurus sp.]
MTTRFLYLARHGEASPDESTLTADGRRQALLNAPPWGWLGLNHCNAALTVIRYAPERPASLLVYNDMTHLPRELRWTGFPPELRI